MLGEQWNVFEEHLKDLNKTLLLVDETAGETSHDLFLGSSRFVVLDASLLAKKKSVQKKTPAAILQEARHSLVYAMRNGRVLVVRLGDSKTDFLGTFCDEVCGAALPTESRHPPFQQLSYLPRSFLLKGGSRMVDPQNTARLFHREDGGDLLGEEELRANLRRFRVLVTTSIPRSKIQEQILNGSFGLPGTVDDYNVQVFSK